MQTLDLVHGGFALPVLNYLDQHGSNGEATLEKSNLPMSLRENPSIIVPHYLMNRFVQTCAHNIGDPLFGFEALAPKSNVSEKMVPFRQSTMFGGPLNQLKEFVSATNATTSSNVTLREAKTAFWIDLEWAKSEGNPNWIVESFAAALLLNGLQTLLGNDWHPAAMKFYARTHGYFRKIRLFDCPISWSAGSLSIAIGKRDLIKRLGNSPRPINIPLNSLSASEFPDSCPDTVRTVLFQILEDGCVPLSAAADRFGVKTRTFKRRLAALGISYSEVMETFRMEHAIQHLDTEISITDLALDLGYDHPQNFARAFRNKFGMTPTHYRRHLP